MNNDVETIDTDITDLAATNNNGGGIIDVNPDNLLILAEKADKYISAMNRIMEAALKITNEFDWVLIGGKPYLQESGATKVARLFGISIELAQGYPHIEYDGDGYPTYTYKARFFFNGNYIDCEGSRSAKDDFFAGKSKSKKPDEIDFRDVKMAAYTNCVNNGIKRLIPNLRNIDVDTLTRAGLDTNKISGYTFKEGAKGGKSSAASESGLVCSVCGEAVTQKVASFSQGKHGKILCMKCQKEANNPPEATE